MAEAIDEGRSDKENIQVRPSSVDLESDQVIDPWCDLCYDESIQFVAADGFCAECNYFLCISCTDAHKRHSRSHEIIRGNQMPNNHADKPVKYRNCAVHSKQVADQFCLDHSIMVCSMCVNTKHHHHCQVSAIQSLSKRISKTHIQEFNEDVASIAQSVLATTETLENNVSDIERQRTCMIENAEDIRDTSISIIRAICAATVTDINETCQLKTYDIDAKMRSLADMTLSLNDTMADIDKTVQPYLGPNEFIRLQEFAEKIGKYKNEINDILEKFGRVNLSFCIVPDISELLSNCKQFGYVEDKVSELNTVQPILDIRFPRTPCDETKVTAEEKNELCAEKMSTLFINEQDDDSSSVITGMAMTSSGLLLIADGSNCKIKVYSTKNQLLSSISLPMVPGDITVIDETTAAIIGAESFVYKQLHFLDISDPTRLTIQSNLSLDYKYFPSLITSCGGYLVVLSDFESPCVKLIDLNAKEQWSTSSIQKSFLRFQYDQKLFKYPRGLACKTDEEKTTIVVTDSGKKTITFLEGSTGNVTKIINEKGRIPYGVTTDFDGNIYVTMGDGIKVLASDLQNNWTIFLYNNPLDHPYHILFDNAAKELLVSYGTNKIDRFQLHYS